MERCEEIFGVKLFIDESFGVRVDGLIIFIHPQYEMITKAILNTLNKDWSSLSPQVRKLVELTPADASKQIKIHLKNFIPSFKLD